MGSIKNDFYCPNCKHKQRIKVYTEVDSSKTSELITRELFKFVCDKCHEEVLLDYPLLYNGENFEIYYDSKLENYKEKSDKEISRFCREYSDFKEKIMLLSNGYNDIVIEFVKSFFINELASSKEKETCLRYDGEDEKNIFFYGVDIGKTIACSKEFYQNIMDKSKIKKCPSFCVIDADTFKKYFKLR